MARKSSKKGQRLQREADELRASRRNALIRAVLGFAAAVVLIGVKQGLVSMGVITQGDLVGNIVVYGGAVVACAVVGMAVMDYQKYGHRLDEINRQLGK